MRPPMRFAGRVASQPWTRFKILLTVPVRLDFGLDQLLATPELLSAAIEGEVVVLRLEIFDVDGAYYVVRAADLEAAFEEKSYDKCSSFGELESRQRDGERGLFLIDE